MKNAFVIFIIIISITSSAFSQRKMNWTFRDEIQRQLGIPFASRINNDVDFRFFVDESLTPSGKVLWMRKKGQEWKVTLYDYVLNFDDQGNDTREIKSFRSRELKGKDDTNELWAKLMQFDILTLPNQSDVTYELQKEASLHHRKGHNGKEHHSFMIIDGTLYDVLVKSNGKSRSYSFHSPCTHLDYFPESKELQNYCNILTALEKEFKIKFEE